MEKGNTFEKEEIKALIIFLSLFFVIFFAYDFAEKAIVLLSDKNQKLADAFGEGLGLWLYSLMVGLFFIGLYFMKWKNVKFYSTAHFLAQWSRMLASCSSLVCAKYVTSSSPLRK